VTARCGLLGQNLGHSYSPSIHKSFGLSYSYELFEVEPPELAPFLEKGNFHGLNVTIPYKTAVIPFCKSLSPIALSIGSVNTILRQKDGSLYGDNTDAAGFLTMIERSGISVKNKKALILGSGGSSLTVKTVLKNLGAHEIIVISRHGNETYENLNRHKDAAIIVNTTPVGMYPRTGKTPVELEIFPHLEGVLDLVYNPARTRLIMDAERLGLPHISGLAMLVSQARFSAELFAGHVVDASKEKAVLSSLSTQMENIILVGMPGCGKTTVGSALAEIMGRPFCDADIILESDAGMSITEIFEKEGVESFRNRETKVLEKLGKESGLVIATGGGCVTRDENYALLHQNGKIIFLDRNISLLERAGRPLSLNADLNEMYAERLPLYQHFADLSVENNTEVYNVAKNIFKKITKKFNLL